MAFNLFGSSKTSSDTTTTIDNSWRDQSVNTNNAGAILTGGGDITMTDHGAFDLSRDLVTTALRSNQDAMDMSLQTATNAIDHGLAVAGQATRSESKELMQTIQKVGLAVAVVLGIGFIVGRKK